MRDSKFRPTTRPLICTGKTSTRTYKSLCLRCLRLIRFANRLNGDYNPLHAAPDLGTKMDFGGTILHGLYSWNAVAHGIVQKLASSNPRALREFSARFASPVKPGDTLITEAWVLGEGEDGFEEVRFVTKNQNDKPVLSNGRALLRRRFDSSKI